MERGKKVISIVLNNFLHDSRVLKECQSLQTAGYEVQVVALHEGDLAEKEVQAGIAVHRIRLSTRGWSKMRAVQMIKWIELFARIVKNYRKVDIIHVNDVLPLPVGVLIKTFFNRKIKVVYDAHELEFNKNVSSTGYGKFLTRLERFCIRRVDAMMTVTDLIADAYVEQYGIKRPAVVMNCPFYHELGRPDIFREKFGLKKDQIIVLYQGGIKPNRGIEELITAFEKYPDPEFVLVLLGFGIFMDELMQTHQNRSNIFLHPSVPVMDLLPHTASADIGIYLIQKTNRSHDLTIGNKLFEYIMSGIPVISSNLSGPKTIVDESLGVILESDTPEAIFAALREIKEKGLESYHPALTVAAKKYNWEEQEKTLLQVYKNLWND